MLISMYQRQANQMHRFFQLLTRFAVLALSASVRL